MKAPVLKTERLLLRPFKYSDLNRVYELCAHPETSRYTLWEAHTSRLDSLRYIYWVKRESQGIHWAITYDGRLVGSCSYVGVENGEGEIGYSIMPTFWGNGFATEAAEAIMSYGFETLALRCVKTKIMLLNTRSLAVAKRLGMEKSSSDEEFVLAKGVRRRITVMEKKRP